MSLLLQVVKELFGMFFADARLAVSVLVLVAVVAILIRGLSLPPLDGGLVLLAGSVLVLIGATLRQARK